MGAFFLRPVEIIRTYRWADLRDDAIAGLTVAVVTLPQAMAYALIAELPPEVGLYAAIVGAIVGALWGSSSQLQTGPTNTTSLLILSVLLTVASPGTPEYVVAAGMMALLVGLVRLTMGIARLGMLVNFVSDSVIVGFTAGAGALILVNQVRHLFRLPIPSLPNLWQTLPAIAGHLVEAHWPSAAIGGGTIAMIVLLRRVNRKLPAPLMAMVVAAAVVAVFGLDGRGVRVVGELPRGLPPFAPPPVTDLDLIGKLATGAFAVAAIGLVEAMSIARTIAAETGQRLDSNQEFVGQGLASIACAFFSGYACSGSFARSAVNHESGAKTALASVFSSAFVLLAVLALAPLAAYIPLAALAGVLILTAIGLANYGEMRRIWQSGRGDRMIMVATLVATLALPLQYAVLSGILVSLVHYLIQTSTPRVRTVLPNKEFRRFEYQPDRPQCIQIGIVEILGDLYFGAVNHIEAYILEHLAQYPDQRFLLLRMHAVDHCDISGIHALESIARAYREQGGDVYLVRVRGPVRALMEASGFLAYLGPDHVLDPQDAIGHLFYHVIDPAICIYECPVRVFQECQNLPKQRYPGAVRLDVAVDLASVPSVDARALWDSLRAELPPSVIDVREPSEFRRAHIPGAQSIPLPVLLNHLDQIPQDRPVVLICRGGRRSTRAAAYLRERHYGNVRVLRGGMVAWENAQLLEAVDRFGGAPND
ncbi:MAG: STAS domain-containing protein [Anaerolineae bacterium]|nr:STAS domain-containing protein [Anaerolineae bacterium]